MPLTESQIQDALKELIDPNTGKDFISAKSAKNIRIDGNNVSLDIVLGYPAKSVLEEIRGLVESKLESIPGIANIQSSFALKQVVYRSALPIAGQKTREDKAR